MSRVGYVRVSSKDQNLDRQIEQLKKANIDYLYQEKVSGSSMKRPKLKELLDFIRVDDVVVVTELDRLSRKADDITKIINVIKSKGATLEVLSLPSTQGIENKVLKELINNLIIEIYKYQAEAERVKIRERQQQGIEIAKAKGRYKGRKRKFSMNSPQLIQAFKIIDSGESIKQASKSTGISYETLRRYNLERLK